MDEQTSEKKHLPIWAIILIVVLVVAVAVLATVLIMNNRQKTTVSTTETTMQSYRSTVAVNDAKNHDNADSNVDPYDLVRPQSSLYINEYTAVASRDDRSFINLRYGPDKTKYGVIRKINNGEQVTIESKPVNGWVFVNYNGTEGWAKAEFLYN
ncbi:MAG: SH3 domain-containing protein [Lachnospiraceae bacterium]